VEEEERRNPKKGVSIDDFKKPSLYHVCVCVYLLQIPFSIPSLQLSYQRLSPPFCNRLKPLWTLPFPTRPVCQLFIRFRGGQSLNAHEDFHHWLIAETHTRKENPKWNDWTFWNRQSRRKSLTSASPTPQLQQQQKKWANNERLYTERGTPKTCWSRHKTWSKFGELSVLSLHLFAPVLEEKFERKKLLFCVCSCASHFWFDIHFLLPETKFFFYRPIIFVVGAVK